MNAGSQKNTHGQMQSLYRRGVVHREGGAGKNVLTISSRRDSGFAGWDARRGSQPIARHWLPIALQRGCVEIINTFLAHRMDVSKYYQGIDAARPVSGCRHFPSYAWRGTAPVQGSG
jgi:hypothetical protein